MEVWRWWKNLRHAVGRFFKFKGECFSGRIKLKNIYREKDAEKAFRAAHTLKGICLNLGFDAFYEVSAALTEKLRGRELTGYEADFASVKECYEKTVAAIKAFEESN